jgi:hypothetical protein
MKQETNNEMDLLLRRLGRQQDIFAPDAGDHLEADELSAYAENVLPVKTRARYTEHLAECSRCRELVVRLSASAGVVIVEQTDKVSVPWGWRKFLAGLFSPMVLRYAVPALGLIVVAAIGLVVLRRQRATELVSQVRPDQSQAAQVAKPVEGFQSPQDGVTNNNSKPAGAGINADAASNKETTKEIQSKDSEQSPATAPQPTPAPADVVNQNAPAAKAPAPKPEAQPVTVASEPPPPARAKLDEVSDKRQQNEDARKQEAEVKVAKSEDSKKNFEVDELRKDEGATPSTARSRVAKNKTVMGGLTSAQGAAAPASGAGRDREEAGRGDKDSSAETRSVAGRRFRKQGSIWVDTAYDQSKAITTYHRDSESYRSLIADEPAIKTIADQLDGEIIVVWKNRTYRIQ